MKIKIDEAPVILNGAPCIGDINKIINPKEFFAPENNLEKIVSMVRKSFGSEMEVEDIYNHVTFPERIYLLEFDEEILAMASYSSRNFSGHSVLIGEGAAIIPEVQANGVFRKITNHNFINEKFIVGKTQNPHIYRAFQKFCREVYPNSFPMPNLIKKISYEYAEYLGYKLDDLGIIRGCYGKCLYGNKMPMHKNITKFFEEDLKMNFEAGDALLLIGVR